MNTEVMLSGLKMSNPIIPASGTFGYGWEFADLYDLNILGSIAIKGTTVDARFGNDTPRIAECPSGMLNSVGLQNPGLDAVRKSELPELAKVYKKPIIANISGFSIEEYVNCASALEKESQVGIIEVNVSCPNVHGGGISFGVTAEGVYEVTKAVKAVSKKPVFIKLSPNVRDIASLAKACEDAGADGISLINTILAMRIDLNTRKPVLAKKMGGLSGPAVLPIAVRMVYQVYEAVSIPIIGMGGISCAEDVLEMMMAGASAVQIGAANLLNPYLCKEIIEVLPVLMQKYNIASLRDIIGAVH